MKKIALLLLLLVLSAEAATPPKTEIESPVQTQEMQN